MRTWVVLSVLMLLAAALAKDPVTVTVLVEAEADDQGSEYVEIEMEIQHQDPSLAIALSEASRTSNQTEKLVKSYCERNGGKSKCKEAVEISNYEIEAKYQQIKREETFVAFIAKYEIVAKVYHRETIGQLVDELRQADVYKIKSFEWKSDDEKSEEAIVVENAMEKGNALCGSFKHQVVDIVSIEEQEPEEPEEGEDDPPATFKVTLTCEPKKK